MFLHDAEIERMITDKTRKAMKEIECFKDRMLSEMSGVDKYTLCNLRKLLAQYGNLNGNIPFEVSTFMRDTEQEFNRINENILFLKNYVTPEMFGANGDGDTDDTEAFTAMLKTKPVNVLLTKRYAVNGLEIPDGTSIIGENGELLCKATIYLNGNNTIKNITLNGQNVCDRLFIIRGSNVTISGCTFKDVYGNSPYFIGFPYDLTEHISNFIINNNVFDGITPVLDDINGNGDGAARAIQSREYVSDIWIYNNIFKNLHEYEDSDYIHIMSKPCECADYPFESSPQYEYSNARIFSNIFFNCKKGAVKGHSSGVHVYNNTIYNDEKATFCIRLYSGKNNIIKNNTIVCNGGENGGTIYGVFEFNYCEDSVISDNTVIGDGKTIESVFRLKQHNKNITITNNYVSLPNADYGATAHNDYSVFYLSGKNISLLNNSVTVNRSHHAVYFTPDNGLGDIKIIDTTINADYLKNGLYLNGSDKSSDILIRNFNLYHNSLSGFLNYITYFNDVKIQDSKIMGCVSVTSNNACEFQNTTFLYDGVIANYNAKVVIDNCIFKDAYTSIINTDTLDLIVRNCIQDKRSGTQFFIDNRGSDTTRTIKIIGCVFYMDGITVSQLFKGDIVIPEINIHLSGNSVISGVDYGTSFPVFSLPNTHRFFNTNENKVYTLYGGTWY